MSSLRRNDDDPKQPFRTVFLSHKILGNGYGVYCYGNRKFMHLHVNYNKERD